MSVTTDAVGRFGDSVAERLVAGGGEPEDLLRGPFERLIEELALGTGLSKPILTGEHRLAEDRIRPDYGVKVDDALIGFIELKAPGKGVDTRRYRGHDKRQWERLACLPNVLYSDGEAFALYRDGELAGSIVRLDGDLSSRTLRTSDDKLSALIDNFLRWSPIPPRRPRELARVTARLCRVLRDEIKEELDRGAEGLHDLANDWRRLLYPDAGDLEFADGYAQTVTFALLLARVEEIEIVDRDLRAVADDLGSKHTLMARALAVLTDPAVLPRLAVSVGTLQRVLAVVDWPTISRSDPAAWLYFYEDFLDDYDPALRKQTGSYYTPVEAADPMVRMVEDLLRTRLGHREGFASPNVTVVDPATGTGTFLFRIMDRIAERLKDDLGPGAVGPALRRAARRLIGFELQAGPYSVAELRLANEYHRLNAALGQDELRLYLTDALSDPFVEDQQLAATFRQIAVSRRRANAVKREEPVVVVIGNPPYKEKSRGHGGWVERGNPDAGVPAPLTDFMPPKELGVGAHAKHLYNLYVYFWRWATWKVFERHPGDRGIVAFVTVAGFLNGPGFAQMRQHMRRWADEIWVIDCSPEGHRPEVGTRIFPGVQQPICITIALRDGTTDLEVPARLRFTSVSGHRREKFAALASLDLDGPEWLDGADRWYAPFLPRETDSWSSLPALDQLLAWSGSGTMPGRTWVVGTSVETLRERWSRLVCAPVAEKAALFSEHRPDRRINTQLSDNLPGYAPVSTIANESAESSMPIRYGFRTLDRGWIIPDKRVINRPNPSVWQIRNAPGQVFLTAPNDLSPTSGPAATFTNLVPDLHHYHGRGGRTYPLWLDSAGGRANVAAGILGHLAATYGRDVTGSELFAYIAAVLGSPAYVKRYSGDLQTPGLRIPLTASADHFERAVALGQRVIWLHTYGERYADPSSDRSLESPRVTDPNRRPRVEIGIPDSVAGMPATIDYDPSTQTLLIGSGRITGVTKEMWEYETSGYKIIRRWFARRKLSPDGKRSSPLDDIVATTWDAEWTAELIDLLHVIALLIDLESEQTDSLELIAAGPLISVDDLTEAGVLPVKERLTPEKPPRQDVLM